MHTMRFQHVLSLLVFLASCASSTKEQEFNAAHAASSLQVKCKVQSASEDVGEEFMWGMWIDGRNARDGPEAYGAEYSSKVKATLKALYAMPTNKEPLQVFLEVVDLLQAPWRRHAKNPGLSKGSEVEFCSRHMPHSYVASIMQGITVTPDETTGANKTVMVHRLQTLFEKYNIKLAESSNKDDTLRALAYLLQNLAFLHPLGDKNGRSRLCLLQYELRRLGIGRGTFMYNNNKDIYFEPLDVYVEKIRGGISMYERAATTKSNPWLDDHEQKHHQETFKRSFDDALEACWDSRCKSNPYCRGTAASVVSVIPQDLEHLPATDFTYDGRPWSQYLGRWRAIEGEITKWLCVGNSPDCVKSNARRATVLDVGSNYGFFLLQMAGNYPKSFVIGIEGSTGAGNDVVGRGGFERILQTPGIKNTMKWKRQLHLENVGIAAEVWNMDRIALLHNQGVMTDIMFLLSVFHHIDNACADQYEKLGWVPRVQGTVKLMGRLLSMANFHVVELPNLGNGIQKNDTMRLVHVYKEYPTAEAFLKAAMQQADRPKELVGPIYTGTDSWLDGQGNRPVFVIKDKTVPRAPLEKKNLQSLFSGTLIL